MHPDITDDDLGGLVERVREATQGLDSGRRPQLFALVNQAPDTRSCPRTVGRRGAGPTRRRRVLEALEEFFAGGGEADLELEQSYVLGDLVVLVGVERQHGTIGGLPDQDWSLR